ncbi:MAG: single-stranded-DNA-specific exonuclease RecJ [Roseburia porci]|nr:single-stranded-DNA-specific exonuclease RecJ [Roseburia porci]
MEQWFLTNKKADFKGIGERFHIDQVTARIIRNRDIIEDADIRKFLSGTVEDCYDPLSMKDMDLLTDILCVKIAENAAIRVIGDYDIDGVMSSYILVTALRRCGANVSVQIPDRMKDGYGLNRNLIDEAEQAGVDTILTCDNGIAAIEEIAYAKQFGMTVLVTDHHEIPYTEINGVREYLTSEADAIVNPHQKECPYPYKELCGAAVAWKMVCVLYQKLGIPEKESLDFLENVAFATVGDVMELTDENRILVREGLKWIHHTKNVGMRALIAQCGLEPEEIEVYHFGFVIGPCINASGRLDTAKRALSLLLETDEKKAVQTANELVVLNAERKDMTAEGVENARKICEEEGYSKDKVIVLYLPEVHESIVGIIAGRIREAYYRPVFVLTKSEEGVKGSGRSIEGYSMYEEMCKCSELFTRFGGHPMAAGLSMNESDVDVFRKRINELAELPEEDLIPKVKIDVPMPMDYVTKDLVREFSLLQPFGKGNPKPVFADRNVRISRMWTVGKTRKIWKMTLITQSGRPVPGIYFGDPDQFMDDISNRFGADELDAAMHGRSNAITLSIVYFPKINSYRGEESLQFEIQYYQ